MITDLKNLKKNVIAKVTTYRILKKCTFFFLKLQLLIFEIKTKIVRLPAYYYLRLLKNLKKMSPNFSLTSV